MPKLRLSETQIMDLNLRTVIAASATFYQVSPEKLARAAGISRASWYRRLKDPETFTVKELRKLIHEYHWEMGAVCGFLGAKEDGIWGE